MATVRELLNGAHRLLGLTASGNVLPEAVYQDNILALNQMLDSWSAESLAVFCTQDQVFTWEAGNRVRTLGPSGDFLYPLSTEGGDPLATENDDVLVPNGNVSFGIKFLNQLQYNNIAVKTVTSTFPQVMWVNMTYPDITLAVYPVPSRTLEFHFVSVAPLTAAAGLETDLLFPPGYLRAFRYNLALELAPEFNVDPAADVRRIAMVSKRTLKRINNPRDIMAMPYSLMARRNRFNIFAGNY
jgi:hypothetical protein